MIESFLSPVLQTSRTFKPSLVNVKCIVYYNSLLVILVILLLLNHLSDAKFNKMPENAPQKFSSFKVRSEKKVLL